MDKLKMHTPDFTQENIAKLAELFPACVTESREEDGTVKKAIDFDQLRQEFSDHVVDGPQERYHLNWPGKREALLAANAPIAKTLRPCRDESVGFDTTKNLFIEGDNLDVLKLLQETYLNNVKMIYIDPPYNTGNDLLYDDDFSSDGAAYLLRSNQRDALANRLVANTEANGRFHSDWLSMLYPRLKLARTLLRYDGIICVSISDVELSNLRALMNEVFGEMNYVNTISVLAKVAAGASGGGEDKRLKKNVEHIVVFARSIQEFNTLAHLYTNRPLMDVIDDMESEGSSWKYTSVLLGAGERVHFKTIKDGDGNPIELFKRDGIQRTTIRKICEQESINAEAAYRKCFDQIFSDTNAQSSIRTRIIDAVGSLDANELLEAEYVPRSGRDRGKKVKHTYISNTVRRVIWLSEVADSSGDEVIRKERLGTLWSDFDYNNVGKEGGIPFPDGKKPIDLIRQCLRLYDGSDGEYMDFFAGSCSFAHAVMAENLADGGTRKFIVAQLPQDLDRSNSKYAAAIRFYDSIGLETNVSAIGKERIRRSGSLLKSEAGLMADSLDIGFRVLKVDSSNMKEVYYRPDEVTPKLLGGLVDNIKDDRSDEDLLFQVLLDWGVDLSLPITNETISGKSVSFVDEDALAACFESGIDEAFVKELAKHKPLRAVFRDAGYGGDDVKINVEQIFTQLSPGTEVKTI